MPSTGPKSKSRGELERLKAFVAKMDRRGLSQNAICSLIPQHFAFTITQPRVQQILTAIRKQYAEERRQDVGASLWEKLLQLREVREEAWNAWELSKRMIVTSSEEQELRNEYDEVNGKRVVVGQKLMLTKAIRERVNRLPDNAYLATICKCLEQEAKLEGLLAPEMLMQQLNQVVIDWNPMVTSDPNAKSAIMLENVGTQEDDPVEKIIADISTAGSPAENPAVYSPNVYSPNVYSPNVYSPNVYSPNVYSPNLTAEDSQGEKGHA